MLSFAVEGPRGCTVLEVLGGCGIFGGCLQCFGGVWHFWRACSVLEGRGILEKPLAVFWRGVAFWRRHLQLF